MHAYVIAPVPAGRPRWQVVRVVEKFLSSQRSNGITGYVHKKVFDSMEDALAFAGEQAMKQHDKDKKLSKARFYVETESPSTYRKETDNG